MDGRNGAFWASRFLVVVSCIFLVGSFVNIGEGPATAILNSDGFTLSFEEPPSPRLVFIVIDAYLVFDAYARMPTVTLPRITAYITGTLPSFGTILTNLATDEIKLDNWVSRLKSRSKRVSFFGDDTWIRLLPGQFEKSDGVTSFFVNDFTEVDHNVTRHLEKELSSDSWDALILHYLGLDHIGHSLGGTSPRIGEKLVEMDQIVQKVHEELSKRNEETFIVVCGDHGMTAAGSHGGASREETRVPVIIWRVNGESESTIEKREDALDERRIPKIEQIDISATIFDLFGMKVPSHSYGISLAGSLRNSNSTQFLEKQHEHFKRLVQEKRLPVSDICEGGTCDLTSRFVRTALEKWVREVQKELIGSASEVPNASLAICVVLLFLTFALSLQLWIRESFLADFSGFLVNVICFASSLIEEEHEIWYFLASSAVVFRILLGLRQRNNWREEIPIISLAVLHRIALGFSQSSRRRWSMDPSLLPEAVFPVLSNLELDDPNTYLARHPVPATLFSFVLWMIFSPNHRYFLLFPFFSHILRFSGYVPLDAYFLAVFRLLVLPVSFFLGSTSSGLLSLLLCVVPPPQLLLIFIIHRIGSLSSKLQLSQSECVFFCMSSFFYLGNSNSLSTLSLTAAYTGLLDYVPLVVAFQLILYTYAGPIAFLAGRASSSFLHLQFSFRISCLVTSLVCLYIFQHHLFVWSVYSPKVVYDIAHVIFFSFVGLLM